MSITFWAPEAPTREVVPFPDQDPDFKQQASDLPEVNLSNTNALAMLELMGLPAAYDGEVPPEAMGPVIERLMRAANEPGARAPALLEPAVVQGALRPRAQEDNVTYLGRGPTVCIGGRDDAYVARRSRHLLELFTQARAKGYRVCWG